jgi:hypothetical protein
MDYTKQFPNVKSGPIEMSSARQEVVEPDGKKRGKKTCWGKKILYRISANDIMPRGSSMTA